MEPPRDFVIRMIDKMIKKISRIIHEEGFELWGSIPIQKSHTFAALKTWVSEGMHAGMDWMAKEESILKREFPQRLMPDATTLLVLGYSYAPALISNELLNDPSRGIIARYALYDDYHNVLRKKCEHIAEQLKKLCGKCEWKAYVDTGPLLEREWAHCAGLGFVGRNSNIIHHRLGSYIFLAELLLNVELPVMQVASRGSCAQCTNCMRDCPTQAIVRNRCVDARRCISYLTIEERGSIPEWVRPLMKNRIYGCDMCQEVCPWNRIAQPQQKNDFRVREELVAPQLSTLLFFDDDAFRTHFHGSPIKRAKREGFMRNIAVALGNWGSKEAYQLLQKIIGQDPSPLVREHAKWAIRQCK